MNEVRLPAKLCKIWLTGVTNEKLARTKTTAQMSGGFVILERVSPLVSPIVMEPN